MSGNPWLGALIWSDLEAFSELKGAKLRSPLTLVNVLLHPGVMAVIVFRLEMFFHRWYLRPFSRLLYILNLVLFGCELMPSAKVGPRFVMPHPVGVGISAGARLGKDVHCLGLTRIGGTWGTHGQPVIGDGCWLLDGAKVFGPVTVGEGSVVAADSMLLESIPPGVVAAGRPARIIGPREKLDVAAGDVAS